MSSSALASLGAYLLPSQLGGQGACPRIELPAGPAIPHVKEMGLFAPLGVAGALGLPGDWASVLRFWARVGPMMAHGTSHTPPPLKSGLLIQASPDGLSREVCISVLMPLAVPDHEVIGLQD